MGTLAFDLERRFPRGATVRAALEVPLDAEPVTVLYGPSGAGKTTVLRCLAGLDPPDAGFIRFDGETWADCSAGRLLPPQRRGVGLLFQEYALFPHLTVAENIGYALRRATGDHRRARVDEVARFLRIADLLARRTHHLSGGQRQRVALARALAPRPRLLLLDEPLSALDAPTREELRGELRALLERAGIPSIVVTHDRVEAMALGDRLAVLAEGGVRQVGAVHEVFSAPVDLVVARVVGTENVAPARLVERREGLALVEVGEARLWAVDPGHLEREGYACIRAEDVVLEPAPTTSTSARNELAGTVRAILEEGPLVRVTLDCGFRLVALVTRASASRLAIRPGASVAALVKAPSIRLIPRAS
ncbi:MAG TPA: ABC transporter ATP-binding protein [Anaeromyxobacteraceae bacterium]|nr:ABC transporter ATP-binding protein [Anaeromyxobacteraceae bacterium]